MKKIPYLRQEFIKPEIVLKEIEYTTDHTFEYVDICQVKDGRNATVSKKKMIKILNEDTLELEQLLKGLSPEVNKIIAIDSGTIVTCSIREVLMFKYGTNKQYYFDKLIKIIENPDEMIFDIRALPENRFAVAFDKHVDIYKGTDDYSLITKYEHDKNIYFNLLLVLDDGKRMISIGDNESVWYCYKNYQVETRLEIKLVEKR